MLLESGIYRLVYEYYEARILFGYYRYGEHLPSISKICEIFQMAPATVRNALAVLEKKGLIRVDARKTAEVIYETSPEALRRNAVEYFAPREMGIEELCESGRLLLEPLWKEGIRKWDEGEWQWFLDKLKSPSAGAVSLPVEFYYLFFQRLGNGLALNFYWEVIDYIRFPYLADRKEKGVTPYVSEDGSRENVLIWLHDQFADFYYTAVKDLQSFLRQNEKSVFPEGTTQVPFNWKIYRQRPQLCYTMVSLVIRDINRGVYTAGDYLPSLPRMAETYQVSISTVRRTLSLLKSLGLTVSYQGKGTQICAIMRSVDFSRPEIKEGMRLHLESLQILALTVRNIFLYTLQHVREEDRKQLEEAFINMQKEGKSHRSFETALLFVEKKCPLSIVRECYGKIREMLAWGYPLTMHRLENRSLNEEYKIQVQKASGFLRDKDYEAFSLEWESIIKHEEEMVRDTLEEYLPAEEME